MAKKTLLERLTGSSVATYAINTDTSEPYTMTAAAAVLSPASQRIDRGYRRDRTTNRADQDWQAEAWELHKEIGLLHFAGSWVSNALSRVRLIAARSADNTDPEPVETGPAAELVTGLAGGVSGQKQLLKRAGLHLFVAGETKLLGRTVDDGVEEWRVCSNSELSQQNETWTYDDGSGVVDLDSDDLIIRAWQPDPQKHYYADSPVRAAIADLRELRGLTMHVSAQVDSRLAGAGLLGLPNDLSFPPSPGLHQDGYDTDTDFAQTLMEAMLVPIKDRDSAAAVVPVILRGPAEAIAGIRHISFATPLDATAKDLRDEARRSVALALDVPPEIVLGTGDINHWGSWQIEESAIRICIAPLATLVCHALTIGWLRPALAAAGVADANEHLLWFDTSPLELRGDRSQAAVSVYDRQELSGDALRRETGFDAGDAPSDEERVRNLLLEAARQNPTLAPDIARILRDNGSGGAVRLVEQARGLPRTADPEGDDTTPEGRGLPARTTQPPEQLAASIQPCQYDVLIMTCDVGMYRALELVGKRLTRPRSMRAELASVPPHEVHVVKPYDRDPDKLLEGAWTSLANVLPPGLYACLEPVLDGYARRLLNTRAPHTREALAEVIASSGCACEGVDGGADG